jgi:hypothetical protein
MAATATPPLAHPVVSSNDESIRKRVEGSRQLDSKKQCVRVRDLFLSLGLLPSTLERLLPSFGCLTRLFETLYILRSCMDIWAPCCNMGKTTSYPIG